MKCLRIKKQRKLNNKIHKLVEASTINGRTQRWVLPKRQRNIKSVSYLMWRRVSTKIICIMDLCLVRHSSTFCVKKHTVWINTVLGVKQPKCCIKEMSQINEKLVIINGNNVLFLIFLLQKTLVMQKLRMRITSQVVKFVYMNFQLQLNLKLRMKSLIPNRVMVSQFLTPKMVTISS